MPKFFSKRKEPYNLRSRSKNQSTPKSKVDACVECDLPFDESKIVPELRRGPVAEEGTSSEPLEPSHKTSVGFNTTNLEPVDISVDSDSDVSSPHRPTAFHGFDSEDINRWLDKVENYLTLRRIDTSTPTALAELILNLAGPAEDFYYSLPGDCKDTFTKLRDALRERFANENQS